MRVYVCVCVKIESGSEIFIITKLPTIVNRLVQVRTHSLITVLMSSCANTKEAIKTYT